MSQPTARRRARAAALLLAAAFALPSAGCYTYHVYQVGGPQGREAGNQPATEWKTKTLHAFAWGAVRQDLPVDNCQVGGQRTGIEEIRVRENLGYRLATVLTLGLWAPTEVSWRCARPPVPTGTLQ